MQKKYKKIKILNFGIIILSIKKSSVLAFNMDMINFKLLNTNPNISKKFIRLFDYTNSMPVVLAFICNHCPYVKHILSRMVFLGNLYTKKGFSFIAISSNNPIDYPEDSPIEMKKISKLLNFQFPYCFDKTQEIAKKYKVACTPDFYCFNEKHKLVYHGRFDQSIPGNKIMVTGKYLIEAMDSILNQKYPEVFQNLSIGCSIKWKY